MTLFDSAHLKPGKKIWVNSLFEVEGLECHVEKDAVIYGRVTAASTSRNPAAFGLGLQFDRVDCLGRSAKATKLTLIAIVAPDSSGGESVHDALPGHGGSYGEWPYGWDQKLDPSGPPNFVHPGEVVGFKKMKLDPHGGPACSAMLTATGQRIELGIGTVLVLAVPDSE